MDNFKLYSFRNKDVATHIQMRNKVLRNTYALLALSLIPTILGTWIGVKTGFSLFSSNIFIHLLLFMGISIGFFKIIESNKESSIGVVSLLGFTFFMGLMLSRLVSLILGYTNGVNFILCSFTGTAIIFSSMATLASIVKKDLSTSLSTWLLSGIMLLILATIANIWLQLPAIVITVSIIAIAIFSAFILTDIQRIIHGGETNYIIATLSLYLSIYNIFSNFLMLFGIFGGDRD